jgi:hypothetical protein
MQLNETNSIVVNEYGTNLVKSKMDPLMVIEAKNARRDGGWGRWYTGSPWDGKLKSGSGSLESGC